MLYLTGASNPAAIAAAATEPLLGVLAQPGNALHRKAGSYAACGIDNGGFGLALKGADWTDELVADYLAYLGRVVAEQGTDGILFATAPDVLRLVDGIGVVGDHAGTVARSAAILPLIRDLGIPAAFVGQDGAELDEDLDWDSFDVLFLGGSDAWKLGEGAAKLVAEAKRRGKWVHMGRVNSYKRYAYAASIGCDSADGTFLAFGPAKNLPRLLGWFAKARAAGLVPAAPGVEPTGQLPLFAA